jgi:Fic family protein
MDDIKNSLLKQFKTTIDYVKMDTAFAALPHSSDSAFGFLMEASAVYSSNIEGNTLDLNSYLKTQAFQTGSKPKEATEISELITSYTWAKNQDALTEKALLEAHSILAETLVIPSNRGAYRQQPIGVFSKHGLVYMAVEHELVQKEMNTLLSEIASVLEENSTNTLPIHEAFFHASWVHLRLAHIHPFVDGNGRIARLVEKWLLAELLGDKAWAVESEKYYKEHRNDYYGHIHLGVNYHELDYSKALPFLGMLPQAIEMAGDN